MGEIVKCRYSRCLHENKELPKSEAVNVNNAYYHKDCLRTKDDIEKIAKTFVEKVNKGVVYSQLYGTIYNIVFNKKISSELLLFGLNYYIEHHIPLHYPGGLFYVVENKDVNREFLKYKTKEKVIDNSILEDSAYIFHYKPTHKKTVADLLRGE